MALLAFVSSTAASARAEAQLTGGKAVADALFSEGKKLFSEGKIDEACQKFEGSYRIEAVGGTLLNLAICHETQRKTATAWGEFNEALSLAIKANRTDRQRTIREHLAALEPKLSRITVSVPKDARLDGLEITIDGVPFSQGAWETAIPIDPGEHTTMANAPGYERWTAKIAVKEAETQTITIPRLKESQSAAPPPPSPPSPPAPTWKRPVGFVALGLGAVGLGLGSYFGVRAISYGSDVSADCRQGVCFTQKGYDAVQSGKDVAMASNVFFGVGLLAVGTGAFLMLTSGATSAATSAPARSANAHLKARTIQPNVRVDAIPLFGKGGAMASIGGTF